MLVKPTMMAAQGRHRCSAENDRKHRATFTALGAKTATRKYFAFAETSQLKSLLLSVDSSRGQTTNIQRSLGGRPDI